MPLTAAPPHVLQREFDGEAGMSGSAISGVSGVDVLAGPAEAGPAMQTAGNTVDLRGMRVDEATRVRAPENEQELPKKSDQSSAVICEVLEYFI